MMKQGKRVKQIKALQTYSTTCQSITTPLKYLVVAMLGMSVVGASQADVNKKQIGDLEIYKAAEGGKVTVMMMLDTSGSMSEPYMKQMTDFYGRSTNEGHTACDLNVRYDSQYTSGNDAATTVFPYKRYYCSYGGKKYYDRITRLKDAIFTLLDSGKLDASKVAIGIGQFSSQSDSSNTYKGADGKSGKILVPAALLTTDQITKIKTAVAALAAGGGTPSANAYAEAAAYMLGTTTVGTTTAMKEQYIKYSASRAYTCTAFSGNNCAAYNNPLVYISDLLRSGYTEDYCKGANFLNEICYSKPVTVSSADTGYSGFAKSVTASKNTADSTKYASPVTANSTCDGNGIYFLTDGAPNSAPDPSSVMKPALGATLGASFNVPSTGVLEQSSDPSGNMPAVGEFAKWLRTSNKNPKGTSIRTAVVGFGSEFSVDTYPDIRKVLRKVRVDKSTGLPLKKADGTPDYDGEKTAVYYDCSQITTTDAKNACQWGAKSHPLLPNTVGSYGEGGFTSAQNTDDVIDSVVKFVDDLNQNLPSTPSGTIVVPDDPYRADSQLAVAYYPILQAEVDKNTAIWSGNMKKYSLNEGTLYGKSNTKLFADIAGTLNPSSEDLWSAISSGENNKVEAGGVYSNLKTPNADVSKTRTVYVEDFTSSTDKTPKIRKLSVNDTGKVLLDGNLVTDSNFFFDTAVYTKANIQSLLGFLGFSLTDAQKAQDIKDLVLTTNDKKILGATVHSTPSMVSYSATLDDDGKVTDTRDDYVLFGSSDGALHLVNADNYAAGSNGGQEEFAFIPKLMIEKQPQALQAGDGRGMGKPYFGVDAPWLVDATYFYDFPNKRVTVTPCAADSTIDPSNTRECRNTKVRAYGGLRMGGDGLYGLDLLDKTSPKLLFQLDSKKAGFERMGQIWAKPTKAKIKTSSSGGYTDVLVFGGGYDTCYEDESYQVGTTTSSLTNQRGEACKSNAQAIGNAVYIVNAKTGELIWSASATGSPTTTVTDMKNSIVGGITALDRNNDGYMDQLYFADLGGQVFRADFTNAGIRQYNADGSVKMGADGKPSLTSAFSNNRVVRILQPAYSSANELQYNHRFYERPVVSFYRGDNSFNNGRLFAVVNVASGDRSSPLSKLRNDNKYADRLYGIFDTDVTLPDSVLYASNFETKTETPTSTVKVQKVKDLSANDLSTSNLLQLPVGTSTTTAAAATTNANSITSVKAKQGWYYPLTRFDGYGNVKYTKTLGRYEVVDSFLYTTMFNPDMKYGSTDSCSAKVTGGSERQLYCLPFGVCLDGNSFNGTGGYIRAGQGIQELTLGPRSATRANQRLLIGTRTLTERANNRVNFGSDDGKLLSGEGNNNIGIDKNEQPLTGTDKTLGSGSAPELIFNERYTLQPRTWYEITK